MMTPRIKAFLAHLVISLIVLFLLLYVVVFLWFPPPFFAADGGWQGVRIIAGVDLVLGPLLTLCVYNPKKGTSRLKKDLIVIGTIQACSLAAGSFIVYEQRTQMVVFANNRFVSLNEAQIRESGVTETQRHSLSTQHPPMAYLELPEDESERTKFVMGNMGGQLLFKRGDLYRPMTKENRLKIVEEGFDLEKTGLATPEYAALIKRFLENNNRKSSELSALPLYCRYQVLSLVMDRNSGEIIDTIDIPHEVLIASLTVKDN